MATIKPEVPDGKVPARGRSTSIDDRLVYTVPEAGRLLGLGRNSAYAAAERGDIPTIRIGRLLLVPKIPLHRMLGIDAMAGTVLEEASIFGAKSADAADKREET
jgi:excisionase family DNA binding protein